MRTKCLLLVLISLLITAISITLSHAWPIPDTGQTKCYDDAGNVITCPQPVDLFYGQDGNYTINPPSYTKLDAQGNALPEDAVSWVMVRDNVTGLIWETKTNKDGVQNYNDPRDADNTYTWYDSNPETNGGDAGTPGEGTDTEDFIKSLNDASFGGFSDWRIPTRKELRSIVDYDRVNPAINTAYFPNTQARYWSSTISSNYAWLMTFYSGTESIGYKSENYNVWAVHGGQSQSKIKDNGDGTVTDTSTGLMWQQATAPGTYTWEQALSYCENLTLAAHSDWRLPTIKELDSIVDLSRHHPTINTTYFSDTVASTYWSSTNTTNYNDAIWVMYFGEGWAFEFNKSEFSYVQIS